MSRKVSLVLSFSILLLATAAAGQQDANKAKPVAITPANSGQSTTGDPNYVIAPQDVLDVSVWKEPDLTRAVPVRPDGKISMPLLNDVQAAGLTPEQLAKEITNGLRKFVNEPQVTIVVSQINSQRIYILGEVNRPGAYPLLPQMSILQGLSSAGGFTIFANVKNVYVLRAENGKQQKYPFNYKDALAGKHLEQNIPLKSGDTIVVR